LLGFDDGYRLAVDQDRVWRAFDLGLLVAQLGGEAVGVVGAEVAGQGKEWVEVELQDLHDAAAGLGEQEQHPFGLWVARSAVANVTPADVAALTARLTDHVDELHDWTQWRAWRARAARAGTLASAARRCSTTPLPRRGERPDRRWRQCAETA
jgi:hypothetical protein